jgi:hypothetical protein
MNFKFIAPFIVVILVFSLIGQHAYRSRPEPGELMKMQEARIAMRDQFLNDFKPMGFSGIVTNKLKGGQKYPIVNVEYELTLDPVSSLILPPGVSAQGGIYDFSDEKNLKFTVGTYQGKEIEEGDIIVKMIDEPVFYVRHQQADTDTMELDWRIFIPEEQLEKEKKPFLPF